jgi:hypothetical protein
LYIFFPVIFLAYLLKNFKTPGIDYLLIVYFAIMFLVKGAQAPFGSIYIFMLKHIPYFGIFKTPAEKFGVLFLFWQAFILSITFKKNTHIVVGALIIILLAYPAYTGNLMPDVSINKETYLKARQKVPRSYKKVAEIINEDELNGRVLLLPLVANYQITYSSTNYRGLPFLKSMIKKPLIGNWDIQRDNVYLFLKNLQNEPVFTSWAKRFNIHWIVLNKDLGSQLNIPPGGIMDIEMMLHAGKNYKRVGEFENLILYKANIKENPERISSEGIIPHIYSPSKINIIKYK